MHREFLDLYNTELRLLYEQAREFAEEYPGIAERLGGLLQDHVDPMIDGLLEGTAFMAARVQLKLKHEFPEFTGNLLEQLVPHYLAPTPSAILAQIVPLYGDPGLRDAQVIPKGSYLDAVYRENDRQVACRFELRSPVTLWPFDIVAADYFNSPAPLQAMGIPVGQKVLSGARVSLTYRGAATLEDEPPDVKGVPRPDLMFSGCRTKELTFHLLGAEHDTVAFYEQLFANCTGIYFRYLDAFGDPVVVPLTLDQLEQIGFGENETLLEKDDRIFSGFDLIREYFFFPNKFLGFKLTNLLPVFKRLAARNVDIVFCFETVDARLQSAVTEKMFSLYSTPAINLFEKTTDRVQIKPNQHEYHIVPDRTRYHDYEPHRLLSVHAFYTGGREKIPVLPLYSAAPDALDATDKLYYTIRRAPRRATAREKEYGAVSDYAGTDIFISFLESANLDDTNKVAELSVRALCSNRHLPELLPVGQGGADFRLLDNVALDVHCLAGPTRPRESLISQMRSRSEIVQTGAVTWRLINLLSLNHLGLVQRGAGRNGQSLRELLSMFADMTDTTMEKRIRGIRSIDSRPIVRRVRQSSGVGVGRGTEVTVLIDEKAFEGSGIFLLGAVLDRFYAEYAGFNHFTQTVIRSTERGEIMRWPIRPGLRRPL